ncbi:MAG: hypothetical protein A4E19_05915 [Nitrospira sp. SG-bin1]|nr:MAG: hypothetical protein A4E19_05915 [Nitrospira sp. SG-bin1]
MAADLLQPALVRLGSDHLQFFDGCHSLSGYHVGQFDPLQSVLIQLVEVHGQIQNPHENVPLAPNRPGRCLRSKTGGNVRQPIFSREGIKRTISEPGKQMSFNHRFRSGQIKPFLHTHRLPVQGKKIFEEEGDGAGCNLLLVPLNLGDHGDRRFFGLLLGQVVPKERTVPFAFPSDVQVKGQAFLRLPSGDGVGHSLGYRYRALRW